MKKKNDYIQITSNCFKNFKNNIWMTCHLCAFVLPCYVSVYTIKYGLMHFNISTKDQPWL